MDRVEIEAKVKAEISTLLDIPERKIQNSDKLVEDLGADSLDEVEIAMAIEEIFDIQIPDEDAETIKTVQDIINYVCDKKIDPPRY